MAVKLYVIPGSHPSKAAELMLEHKGIPYKRVDLVMAMHRPSLRMLGFHGKTVPAMKADGRKVQGTRRDLALRSTRSSRMTAARDLRRGQRRPSDGATNELQPVPRRLAFWALLHLSGQGAHGARRGCRCRATGSGMPIGVARRTGLPLIAKMAAGYNHSTDENVRADLAALPGKIDRVDALIAEGVIGGDTAERGRLPDRDDVRLLLAYEDLKPYVEGRPAADARAPRRARLQRGVPEGLPRRVAA